ncbi:hypothetical protein BOTCAL_0327g00170 [Botryotinia calthae]|uniref:Uncharacterized protein n=1 Tax=Botryotinia calthae TaxID=38488 RepID=A0A4Y8CVQ0_9HELO|nr:hypothetical protein BOTCAL_0327g00170 [Botryotinia calthae]
MNTTSFASYPILSFPITTLLLTLFFISLLYIPRFLFLYLRTRILHFWTRNLKKRMSHFEALDLARAELGLGSGSGNRAGDGDRKTKSKHWWDIDLERGEEEEENEWVTKGEMAKEWICEGEEKWEMRRLGVGMAEESRWLHFVGRNGGDGGEDERMDEGEDEKVYGEYENEKSYAIAMRDKELDG